MHLKLTCTTYVRILQTSTTCNSKRFYQATEKCSCNEWWETIDDRWRNECNGRTKIVPQHSLHEHVSVAWQNRICTQQTYMHQKRYQSYLSWVIRTPRAYSSHGTHSCFNMCTNPSRWEIFMLNALRDYCATIKVGYTKPDMQGLNVDQTELTWHIRRPLTSVSCTFTPRLPA